MDSPKMVAKPVVCQVLPALNAGGVERGTVDIARALVGAKMGSLVVSAGGRLVSTLAKGVQHIPLPMASKNPLQMFMNAWALIKCAQHHRVTLIHARSRAPAWSAYLASKVLKLPFVTTYHGTYNGTQGPKRWYNSVMTKGDVVIAPSAFIRTHILKVHGAHLDPKIRVIHRGVDLSIFKPDEGVLLRAQSLRARWAIPAEAILILFPGRVTRWKGHEDALQAFKYVLNLHHTRPVHLLILGEVGSNQTFYQRLQEKIAELKLDSYVHFQPHEADMPGAYRASDVVLAPSREPEAFGRVFAEAGAMGRLVISTNHGGAAEVIVPGQTGWLVSPGHPEKLAQALQTFLTLAPMRRQEMEEVAIQHVSQHFSLESMERETLGVYKDLMA